MTNDWRDATHELPEPGRFVLAVVRCGKMRSVIRAMVAGKYDLEMHSDCDGGEYNEADDTFYCAPGWYECNAFDEINWAVDGTVTHWMPLPEPPDAE